jgi:UDP-N-acetylglucosamine:LPS N-acetylglucosamine transferase
MQQGNEQPMQVLIHAINGALGHLSRLIAVVDQMRSLSNIPVLPLFLSEADTRLLDAYGLKYLPIGNRDRAVRYGWPYAVPSLSELLVASVEAVVSEWKPALVIHDTHLWEPLLRVAASARAKQVAIVRNTPRAGHFMAKNQSLLNEMDLVLFPHDEQDMPEGWTSGLVTRYEYVGEICRSSPLGCASDIGTSSAIRVLVTAGGGGISSTPSFFLDAAVALKQLRMPQMEVTFVLGPCYTGELLFSGLQSVRVLPFVEDMRSLVMQHDIVICQGGYNTLTELRHTSRRVVCMPQYLRWDDQSERIERLVAEHSRFRVARSREELTTSLRQLVSLGKATEEATGESALTVQGAQRAAHSILRTMGVE